MSCCAFYCEEKCVETYIDHIKNVLKAWSSVKSYYKKPLNRVIGAYNFDPIAIALTLHDIGKILKIYKIPRYRYMYRHEIIGAYVVYKILHDISNDLAITLSLAVMLHHEPAIIGAYMGELGERYLTLTTLRSILENYSDMLVIDEETCNIDTLVQELALLKEVAEMRDKIFVVKKTLYNLNSNILDIIETMRELILASSVGSPFKLNVLRNKVATLLHMLAISDSIGAYIGRRSKCKKDNDEGTWIIERIREGAEPISIDSFMEVMF
jgi:CRISPR/Cas system-associated endonuclease Cas3-HD